MRLAGRVRGGAAHRPADGILRAGADRPRCPRARGRGAPRRYQSFRLRGKPRARSPRGRASPRNAPRHGERRARAICGPPRAPGGQGARRRGRQAHRRAAWRGLRLAARSMAAHRAVAEDDRAARRRRRVLLGKTFPPQGAMGRQGPRPRRRSGRSARVRTTVDRRRRAEGSLGLSVLCPAKRGPSVYCRRGIMRNGARRQTASRKRVCVSGLISVRQRPGSANGVIFLSIADETALANIIVWPNVFERFRPIVLGARYVAATGRMQEESGVIHAVAESLADLTFLLGRLAEAGTEIEGLARWGHAKRPHQDPRDKPPRSARRPPFEIDSKTTPELAGDLAVPAPASPPAPPTPPPPPPRIDL